MSYHQSVYCHCICQHQNVFALKWRIMLQAQPTVWRVGSVCTNHLTFWNLFYVEIQLIIFFLSFSWSVLVLPITMAMKTRLNFCVLSRRNCITLLMAQPVNPVKKQRWVTRHWTKEIVLNWVSFTSHDKSISVLDHYLIVLVSPCSELKMIPCPLYEGLYSQCAFVIYAWII